MFVFGEQTGLKGGLETLNVLGNNIKVTIKPHGYINTRKREKEREGERERERERGREGERERERINKMAATKCVG